MGKKREGGSDLFLVKDRYSEVQEHGKVDTSKGNLPWYYMGRFIVDDTREVQELRVSVPKGAEETKRDKYDAKADQVHEFLKTQPGKRFESVNGLFETIKGSVKGFTASKSDYEPTLHRLVWRRVLEWPELPDDAKRNASRPGWLKHGSHTFTPTGNDFTEDPEQGGTE